LSGLQKIAWLNYVMINAHITKSGQLKKLCFTDHIPGIVNSNTWMT